MKGREKRSDPPANIGEIVDDGQHIWRALSEAGLVDIGLEDFGQRIKEVKHTVIVRLRELLDRSNGVKERESAAYSLGTLTGIEFKLKASFSTGDPTQK